MSAPSEQRLEDLARYAELRAERNVLVVRLRHVEDDLAERETATLDTLREVGSIQLPVEGGSMMLFANRDEDGWTVEQSFAPAQSGGWP